MWFALLSLLAMASVALDGWRRARGLGPLPATVAALLVFTNFSAAICLSYGQYGVIVAGVMAAAVRLLERDRGWTAGAMLGLALVKPQLAAPYCVAIAASHRWRAVLAIGATIAAGTVLMALAVGEPPLAVSSRAIDEMSQRHTSSNPLLAQVLSVLHHRDAVLWLGLAGAALIAALASHHRRDPYTLVCLSIVVAMFWTHRKHFDVVPMSLPLI